MHICHVIGRLMGGPATSVRYLVLQQLAAGHDVTCIYGAKYETEAEIRKVLPPPTRLVPFVVDRDISVLEDGRALRALMRELRALSPDLVHLHSSKAGALGRLACWRLGLPNVYSPRSISYLRRDVGLGTKFFHAAIEAGLALLGGPVVACSAGEYAAIRRLPCKVAMIPNQIDVTELDHVVGDAPTPSGPFRVVICGRIEPQKNPAMVARLVAAAPADWEWVWVGGGSLECLLDDLPAMQVTGWMDRDDVLRHMHGADVLLHATAWEGMPNAVLEAMALARPIVTTDVEGNRDLVRHGTTGFVCRDEAEILASLRCLAEDRGMGRTMGQAGRAVVLETYSPEIVTAQWSSLYASLVRA
jgi:glycosyltransferase involved in cell wall biosynthesis